MKLLRKGGKVFVKTLNGDSERGNFRVFEKLFTKVERLKPDASRKASSEFYYFAKGFLRTEFGAMVVHGLENPADKINLR